MTADPFSTFEPDGRAVPYLEEGEGPVRAVLLPGLGLGISSFVTVAHFLEEAGVHLLRVGVRQNRTEDVTLHDLAQDVADVMAHTGFGSSWIVGHGFGGALARTVALDHPGLVGGIGMIGVQSPATDEPALAIATADTAGTELRDAAGVLAGAGVDPEFAASVLTVHRRPASATVQAAALAATPTADWTALAPNLPVLIVQGSVDAVGTPAAAEDLRATAPERVSVTVVDGAGHLGLLTHPGDIGFAIEDYLAWD